MTIPNQETLIKNAATGWQQKIKGTLLNVSGALVRSDIDGNAGAADAGIMLAGGGTLAASGTYYFYIPVAGCAAVDVTLRASTVTGTHTITLYPVLSDGVTIKGTATAVSSLVAATQATTSITTLRGEKGVILKIVVAAASTLAFDQAEASAL